MFYYDFYYYYVATTKKRETEYHFKEAQEIFTEIQNDSNMEKLWEGYQKKFSYARDISWEMVMECRQYI